MVSLGVFDHLLHFVELEDASFELGLDLVLELATHEALAMHLFGDEVNIYVVLNKECVHPESHHLKGQLVQALKRLLTLQSVCLKQ